MQVVDPAPIAYVAVSIGARCSDGAHSRLILPRRDDATFTSLLSSYRGHTLVR